MRLAIGALALIASLGASCLVPGPRANPVGCSQDAEPGAPFALLSPHLRQVFQQRDGVGEIRVRGTLVGIEPGAVLVRYRGGAWTRAEADPATGAFEVRLPGQPIGWGAFEIALERDPGVSAVVTPVGVGNVVALAGQSNMVMHLDALGATRRGATVLGTRRDPLDPQAVRWANDPIHDCADVDGSIWPAVGDRIIRGTRAPVMFVAAALGGTGLVATGEWLPQGGRFRAMLEQIATATGGGNCVAALLWHQGETDAITGVEREAYRDGLIALASAFAAATSCPVPILAGEIGDLEGDRGLDPARVGAIRDGTRDAIDASPHLFAGPSTRDLPIDNLHFGDAAAPALIERWCAALAAAPTGLSCAE